MKKKIKNVALLTPSLERGGMERVVANLSELLEKSGYKVYIYVSTYNKKSAYPHKGRIVTCNCRIDSSSLKREILSYYINAYLIKMLKKKYMIDVTISFAPEMNLVNVLSGGKDKKFLTIHNCMSLRNDIESIAYKKSAMLLNNLADGIIPVCKWCSDDLQMNYRIKPSKLNVIYNPAEINRKNIFTKKDNILLCVGRLEEVKQQWHVIKAFKYVSSVVNDAELWIVGDGPYENRLKNLVSDLNIDNKVKFLGFVDNVNELYSKAKVLIMTSKSEAFPCVAVEALSNGIPIVASHIPGGLIECMGQQLSGDGCYPIEMSAGYITKACDDETKCFEQTIDRCEIDLGRAIIDILDENVYKLKATGALEAAKKFDAGLIRLQWEKLLEG